MFLSSIITIVFIAIFVLPSICRADTTKVSDIIVPEVFNPYVINRTVELSNLVQSGIVQNTTEFDRLAQGGGRTINMPHFNDLTGDDEVLSDSAALTPAKITTGQDVAILIQRGRAWSVNDLSSVFAGSDPMKAIADLVANFWVRKMQTTLLAILKGVFSVASMTGKVHDIHNEAGDAGCFTSSTFIDATQTMGDAKEILTGIMMHSATEASLAKQDLITTVVPSDGSPAVKYYMGKQVIIDDSCPVDGTDYTTYIFGQGAIALGNANLPVDVETARDALSGENILVNRKAYIMHPRGIKFLDGSVAGLTPTNTEFEAAANWLRVYDEKKIRIVKFVHKLK